MPKTPASKPKTTTTNKPKKKTAAQIKRSAPKTTAQAKAGK